MTQFSGDTSAEERRTEIIRELIDSGLVDRCIKYQTKGCDMQYWVEELKQETWLWLITYDADKLLDAYDNGHINALITAFLRNQFHSSTSTFYKRYKKWDRNTDEITEPLLNLPW